MRRPDDRMQRTVIPALAEAKFGVPEGSTTALFAFVVSFGVVKGAMNFVSGRLSERLGRRRALIWGWIVALPIPAMILLAPSWWWIVATNVLRRQPGFLLVDDRHRQARHRARQERGLATGLNEFAGYGAVALAGLATGYLASLFDPRLALFAFGTTVILLALAAAFFAYAETLPFAHAEAKRHDAGASAGPRARYAPGLGGSPSAAEVFAFVTWRHRTFQALAQAGCVEKFVDALFWVLVPAFLAGRGAGLVEIGWIAGIYAFVWGVSQLWTGPLSDRIGRKVPIVSGFVLCAAGVTAFPMLGGTVAWSVAAAMTGIGMALLYPTLIAAMGDVAHPAWRGTALGTYRFWRDIGYAIGALAIGSVADAAGTPLAGFWFTGLAMAGSGAWVILAMQETHGPFSQTGATECVIEAPEELDHAARDQRTIEEA